MYRVLFGGASAGEFNSLHEAIKEAESRWAGGSDPSVGVRIEKVEVVREWPRLLTEEERRAITTDDVLKNYANMSLCGDGLEIDLADSQFYEMEDVEFLDSAIFSWEDDGKAALQRAGLSESSIDKIFKERGTNAV